MPWAVTAMASTIYTWILNSPYPLPPLSAGVHGPLGCMAVMGCCAHQPRSHPGALQQNRLRCWPTSNTVRDLTAPTLCLLSTEPASQGGGGSTLKRGQCVPGHGIYSLRFLSRCACPTPLHQGIMQEGFHNTDQRSSMLPQHLLRIATQLRQGTVDKHARHGMLLALCNKQLLGRQHVHEAVHYPLTGLEQAQERAFGNLPVR